MSIVTNMVTESRPIKWVFDEFHKENLFVDESFQRNYTWIRKDRISLMETIILGYPIPEIYLWETGTDPKNGDTKYSIVDGQQRIRTIGEFIDNKLKLTNSGLEFNAPAYRGMLFSELDPILRSQIWAYKISIRFVKEVVSRDDIVKMFLRLNKTSNALNPQELRNAEFDGEFLRVSEKVASLEFWKKRDIFGDSEIRRMQDIQFASTLLIFVKSGFEDETTQSAINKMYDLFNENYPNAAADVAQIEEALNLLDKAITARPYLLTPLAKKTHLYTTFTLSYALKDQAGLDIEKVADLLARWFHWIENAEKPSAQYAVDVAEYRRLSQEGVQKKTNRLSRFSIIQKYVTQSL
jgi:Protein of unknown function DUF262